MSGSDHELTVHLHDKPEVEVKVFRGVGEIHANWLNITCNTFELTVFCRTPNDVSDLAHQISRQLMKDLFANAYKEIRHVDNTGGELQEDPSVQDMSIPQNDWSDLQTAEQEIGRSAFTLTNAKRKEGIRT